MISKKTFMKNEQISTSRDLPEFKHKKYTPKTKSVIVVLLMKREI